MGEDAAPDTKRSVLQAVRVIEQHEVRRVIEVVPDAPLRCTRDRPFPTDSSR